MIAKAKMRWAKTKTSWAKRLGIRSGNTKRLRGRIRAAIEQKRFFQYLTTVKPALPVATALPVLGVPRYLGMIEVGGFESIAGWLKLLTLLGTMVLLGFEIVFLKLRFDRLCVSVRFPSSTTTDRGQP